MRPTIADSTDLRLQSDSYQFQVRFSTIALSMTAKVLTLSLVTRRRSSRLQSRQSSVSIAHILRSQSPLERRTDSQPSERVPASSCIEISVPVSSRTQFQGWSTTILSGLHKIGARASCVVLTDGDNVLQGLTFFPNVAIHRVSSCYSAKIANSQV
jgi:hypothetical protein